MKLGRVFGWLFALFGVLIFYVFLAVGITVFEWKPKRLPKRRGRQVS